MAFVAYESAPIPEVELQDTDTLRSHLGSVMRLDLPGFLIRQIGSDPAEAHACLAKAASGFVNFERPYDREPFENQADGLTMHIDFHSTKPDWVQLNEYTVQKGKIAAALFQVIGGTRQHLKDSSLFGTILDYGFMESNVLHIDDTFLHTLAYTADLDEGDLLLFTDSAHPHDFRPLTAPRLSTATVYHLPPVDF